MLNLPEERQRSTPALHLPPIRADFQRLLLRSKTEPVIYSVSLRRHKHRLMLLRLQEAAAVARQEEEVVAVETVAVRVQGVEDNQVIFFINKQV